MLLVLYYSYSVSYSKGPPCAPVLFPFPFLQIENMENAAGRRVHDEEAGVRVANSAAQGSRSVHASAAAASLLVLAAACCALASYEVRKLLVCVGVSVGRQRC